MEQNAYQAMIRFGWGCAGTDKPPSDPVTWLSQQVAEPDPVRFPPNLPSSTDGLVLYREQLKLRLPPDQSLVRPLFNLDDATSRDRGCFTSLWGPGRGFGA